MLTLFDLLGTARHCLTLFGTVSLSLAVLPLLDLGDYLCWLGSSWQLWAALGSSGQLLAALGSSGQLWAALASSCQLRAALGNSWHLAALGSSW